MLCWYLRDAVSGWGETVRRLIIGRGVGRAVAVASVAACGVLAAIPASSAQAGVTAELVNEIQPGAQGGDPSWLADVNGTLYFAAADGPHGKELWRSDGTVAGTRMVKDIAPGDGRGSAPQSLTADGDTLYFTADDGTHGHELWRSDGTAAGTRMVRDINPGGDSGYPFGIAMVRGVLFFPADDGSHGIELWRSDGTPAGTTLVKDIRAGRGSEPSELTAMGGSLYFTANENRRGRPPQLWRSDGTAAGTTIVKEINPGFAGGLTVIDGTLYFRAVDDKHGGEPWRSDGTAAGTKMLKDIARGHDTSYSSEFTAVDDALYFSARDGAHGDELWRSDGTKSGTKMVKDIKPGGRFADSRPGELTAVGRAVYFTADDGTHGRYELWRSAGTRARTKLVRDINQGHEGSDPQALTDVDGVLYFSAADEKHGRELWRTVKKAKRS